MPDNPYVGPTAFTEKDSGRFFGRTDETRELTSLVIARRAVLLYAQSGSGKTSLLQASLIPELKRRKRVETFPIARVMGSSDSSSGNLYVQNALVNLFPNAPRGQTFFETFGAVLSSDPTGRRQPHLVIFDQFEEIFTFHPELISQRKAFFQQLGECLAAWPQLSLLLSMREDYLADLEEYAALLPDRARTRMRLERLGVENSLQAIREPAAIAGMPFHFAAAQDLVDNLRRIRTGAAGANGFALGQYVEPVQLQIVCRQLWSRLIEDTARGKTEIDADDIAKYANVDHALIQFYRDALARAQQEAGVTERALRRWFGERLITPAGTRGLVYRGETETEGLANAAVDLLRDCYIIRADLRGGNTWYELAHDRLLEPVREDNLAWKAGYRNPVADAMERGPDSLLSGASLIEARQYALGNAEELTPQEGLFMKRSEAAEKNARARRFMLIGTAAAVMLVLAILLAMARHEKAVAERALLIANSGQLVYTAIVNKYTRLDLAALLSIEARRANDSFEARNSILSSLQANPGLISILHRHSGGVHSVVFSPGGKLLASAGEDQMVWLWDVASHQPLGDPLKGHSGPVRDAAFSPDGRLLASSSEDQTVRLWDVASRRPLGEPLRGHSDAVWSVVFSPDGKLLASASEDRTVRLWDVASRQPLGDPLRGHSSPVQIAAFSPNGKLLASSSEDGLVRLWDVASRQPSGGPLKGHSNSVWSVAFSPDGKILASASEDQTVRLWDLATHRALGDPLKGHSSSVGSVAFSPDGKLLASSGEDEMVRLWDVTTRRPLGDPLKGHSSGVSGVAFSPDGKLLASASEDDTLRLWDVASRQPPGDALTGHSAEVDSVALSPDGQLLASGSEDRTVRLWDVASRRPLGDPLTGHSSGVTGVAFSADGRLLASASRDKTVRLWDVAGRRPLGDPLTGHSAGVTSVAFSPDGKLLASSSEDETVRLWDVASHTLLGDPLTGHALTGHTATVWRVVFSPDGKLLGSASEDKRVRLWDVASRQPRGDPIKAIHGNFLGMAFSPDGKLLASANRDHSVRLWEMDRRKPLGDPLPDHFGAVTSVAFSPDGKLLASVSEDKTVRLWDVVYRRQMGDPLQGHAGSVRGVAFSPDGKLLASASDDKTVRLWNIDNDPASWTTRLCRVANRNLSLAEWQQYMRPGVPYQRTCPELPPGRGAPSD